MSPNPKCFGSMFQLKWNPTVFIRSFSFQCTETMKYGKKPLGVTSISRIMLTFKADTLDNFWKDFQYYKTFMHCKRSYISSYVSKIVIHPVSTDFFFFAEKTHSHEPKRLNPRCYQNGSSTEKLLN